MLVCNNGFIYLFILSVIECRKGKPRSCNLLYNQTEEQEKKEKENQERTVKPCSLLEHPMIHVGFINTI
jgi:hypothetical protein